MSDTPKCDSALARLGALPVLAPEEQAVANLRGAILDATNKRDMAHRAMQTAKSAVIRRDVTAERVAHEYWSGKVDAYQDALAMVQRAFVTLQAGGQ